MIHPQVSITFQTDTQKFNTIEAIFDYLENLGEKVVVAIDEFQQIRKYEGVCMEAFLRSKIQNLRNVRFIFSGSDKHLRTKNCCTRMCQAKSHSILFIMSFYPDGWSRDIDLFPFYGNYFMEMRVRIRK